MSKSAAQLLYGPVLVLDLARITSLKYLVTFSLCHILCNFSSVICTEYMSETLLFRTAEQVPHLVYYGDPYMLDNTAEIE